MPRKIVGGFVLLLAIFAIPVWAEEWSKTFELNGKADLHVETNDARVQVEAWERKEIQARVVSEGVRIGLWAVRTLTKCACGTFNQEIASNWRSVSRARIG